MTDWLTESRKRQGLPPDRIEDPAAVARLRVLLRSARSPLPAEDRNPARAA